ncbi:MAG: hypothetical protein SNJ69_13745 [Chloroflexaceae bacterium]
MAALVKTKLQCVRCGHSNQSIFDHREFYSCKNPRCRSRGLFYCGRCMTEMDAPRQRFFGKPTHCPRCKHGELQRHEG